MLRKFAGRPLNEIKCRSKASPSGVRRIYCTGERIKHLSQGKTMIPSPPVPPSTLPISGHSTTIHLVIQVSNWGIIFHASLACTLLSNLTSSPVHFAPKICLESTHFSLCPLSLPQFWPLSPPDWPPSFLACLSLVHNTHSRMFFTHTKSRAGGWIFILSQCFLNALA